MSHMDADPKSCMPLPGAHTLGRFHPFHFSFPKFFNCLFCQQNYHRPRPASFERKPSMFQGSSHLIVTETAKEFACVPSWWLLPVPQTRPLASTLTATALRMPSSRGTAGASMSTEKCGWALRQPGSEEETGASFLQLLCSAGRQALSTNTTPGLPLPLWPPCGLGDLHVLLGTLPGLHVMHCPSLRHSKLLTVNCHQVLGKPVAPTPLQKIACKPLQF